MSRKSLNVVIFSNLPSGGASEMAKENIKFLKKNTNTTFIREEMFSPKNLFDYMFFCIFKLSNLHRNLNKRIPKKTNVIIAYHSWLTKSPYILRYSSLPKIYVCQEVMREYYDIYHIKNQTFKEKIVNAIRLPIKNIDKKNLNSSNLVVISNSKLSKMMIDNAYGIKSHLIYPGIDVNKFTKNKNIKKINQVISVGAINILKGYDYLIKVISRIDPDIRPKFLIVGNGYDKRYLMRIKELAKTLKVNLNIRINITEKELIEEYHRSKLFLYSPVHEPFGIVVEEAMASGLPLVVSKDGGGYSEIINIKNGLIFDSYDEQEWADGISNLLANENIIKKYGEYNVAYVNKYYNSEVMNNNLWSVIKSL